MASTPETKRQLHILEPPSVNESECPVDPLEIEGLGGIAGPSVRTLKEEPGRRVSQKRSHVRLDLLINRASNWPRNGVPRHAPRSL